MLVQPAVNRYLTVVVGIFIYKKYYQSISKYASNVIVYY